MALSLLRKPWRRAWSMVDIAAMQKALHQEPYIVHTSHTDAPVPTLVRGGRVNSGASYGEGSFAFLSASSGDRACINAFVPEVHSVGTAGQEIMCCVQSRHFAGKACRRSPPWTSPCSLPPGPAAACTLPWLAAHCGRACADTVAPPAGAAAPHCCLPQNRPLKLLRSVRERRVTSHGPTPSPRPPDVGQD